MIKVLLLFLVLIAGIILGPLLAGHQGYVLIQTTGWNIETSVTGLVVALVVLLVALFVIEWILRRLFRAVSRSVRWFSRRKYEKAMKQTNKALLKLAEGDYKQVEKLLTKNADYAHQPVANYLLAAEAAAQEGDILRSNQHLERAASLAGEDQLPVDIARVRVQLNRGELEQASQGVERLLAVAPRHPEVLRLAEQAYRRTGRWQALLDILPAMKKAQVYDEAQAEKLYLQAWSGLIEQQAVQNGGQGLAAWWEKQPRKVRNNRELQYVVASRLIHTDEHNTAQRIILNALKQQDDERFMKLIPLLTSDQPDQLEKYLRKRLKQSDVNHVVYSAQGQVLMRLGEWQAASEAFNTAIQLHPSAHYYLQLAEALEKLEQPHEAAHARQKGMALALEENAEKTPAENAPESVNA